MRDFPEEGLRVSNYLQSAKAELHEQEQSENMGTSAASTNPPSAALFEGQLSMVRLHFMGARGIGSWKP